MLFTAPRIPHPTSCHGFSGVVSVPADVECRQSVVLKLDYHGMFMADGSARLWHCIPLLKLASAVPRGMHGPWRVVLQSALSWCIFDNQWLLVVPALQTHPCTNTPATWGHTSYTQPSPLSSIATCTEGREHLASLRFNNGRRKRTEGENAGIVNCQTK